MVVVAVVVVGVVIVVVFVCCLCVVSIVVGVVVCVFAFLSLMLVVMVVCLSLWFCQLGSTHFSVGGAFRLHALVVASVQASDNISREARIVTVSTCKRYAHSAEAGRKTL